MRPRQRRSAPGVLTAVIAAGAVAGMPRMARADDDADEVDEPTPRAASPSVASVAVLPSVLSANSEGRRGIVTVMAGWDQARRGGVYDTAAEAQLVGRLSLRAGASYDGPGTIASPHVELRLDAADQARSGVDLAVSGGYTDAGFNTVPAATLKLAVGRSIGASYLLANVGYEHGLQDGERAGELRLAALYPVSGAAHLGVDSRFQVDLERDASEPAGETEWEWRSGLVASYTWDRYVFSGEGGVSALRLRAGGSTTVGPAITAGFGTVF